MKKVIRVEMKKLTRDEMKKVSGGNGEAEISPNDGGNHGGQCNFGTGSWVGSCTAADLVKYCSAGGYCY